MSDTIPTVTATPTPGTTLRAVGDEITVLLDQATSGGACEVFELTGPEGSGPPPHAHPWLEAYFVLDGAVQATVGDTTAVHGPGDFVTIPAGTLHSYCVASAEARMLVLTTGDRASRFFADLDANVPPGTPTPETFPVLISVARRNGLTSPLFG